MTAQALSIVDAATLPAIRAAMKALDQLEHDVETADSFKKLDGIARRAAAMQTFHPVKEVSDKAGSVWIEADAKLAEELDKQGKAKGGKPYQKSTGAVMAPVATLAELGLPGDAGKKRAARARKIGAIPKPKRKIFIEELKAEGKGVTPNAVLQKMRAETKATKKHQVATAVFSATGPFNVVVIDPPWPMQKIDRDDRPNQDAFDFPVMTEEDLQAWWLANMAGKLSPDCHLFCWTTQKFLPMSLRLVEHWGFKYVLLMVWHKPGGFQPHDLPQYNCEFVIYARKGAPVFIETTAFCCCFEALRREHSRKPDEFYDAIRRVTGGSRIDIFSREAREGFAQYGNEIAKFAKAS